MASKISGKFILSMRPSTGCNKSLKLASEQKKIGQNDIQFNASCFLIGQLLC